MPNKIEFAFKYNADNGVEEFEPINECMRQEIRKHCKDGDYIVAPVTRPSEKKLRTIKQNSALHVWFNMISDHLNANHMYVSNVIKLETEWTPDTVKELLYKPVQKSLINKPSTTEATTVDQSVIVEALHRAFAMSTKTNLPEFPRNR